jgi:hypothetical protein
MGPHNIGSIIKCQASIAPKNAAAGTTNGAAINRLDFGSCVLHLACGPASGGPSAQTVDAKLQESEDGSTNWTDITGAAVTQLTADNTESQVDVNLLLVKKHIRAVVVNAFTGGSSPAIPTACTIVFGGARTEPI